MSVSNIIPATAAHIHKGAPGEAGPVVVPLPTPYDGYTQGCMHVSKDTAHAIHDNPWQYYVNVHNEEYPDGAVRGQLGY